VGSGQATRSFSLLEFFAPFGENKKRGVTDSKKGVTDSKKGVTDSKKGVTDSKIFFKPL